MNTDIMTYEQLLQLEEGNGKVSKGLSQYEINLIQEIKWKRPNDTTNRDDKCTICYENYIRGDKVKELKSCNHSYHSKCINQWLEKEKRCPVCNK